ncbi:MAG TPA: EamA family transporter [Desulfohalobiaceae bacterium]|nr:EamA family transporter [Desulfohalobiaceae bacterium]
MNDWYVLSLAALILIGGQRFLYKVAANMGCSTTLTTFFFMGTVAVLSSISFVLGQPKICSFWILAAIALFNSLTFVIATLAHIQALKHLPAALTYPFIRLNIVLVVIFSIFFFGDDLVLRQWVGVFFSLIALFVLSRQVADNGQTDYIDYRGFLLVFIAMLAGALSAISSKLAALYSNKLAFIALTYICSTGFSFIFSSVMFSSSQRNSGNALKSIVVGVTMGFLNLAGFYLFLEALATGPLSIVASIVGMHFVVAVVLSLFIYKEHITKWGILGLILTIVSIFFLQG